MSTRKGGNRTYNQQREGKRTADAGPGDRKIGKSHMKHREKQRRHQAKANGDFPIGEVIVEGNSGRGARRHGTCGGQGQRQRACREPLDLVSTRPRLPPEQDWSMPMQAASRATISTVKAKFATRVEEDIPGRMSGREQRDTLFCLQAPGRICPALGASRRLPS